MSRHTDIEDRTALAAVLLYERDQIQNAEADARKVLAQMTEGGSPDAISLQYQKWAVDHAFPLTAWRVLREILASQAEALVHGYIDREFDFIVAHLISAYTTQIEHELGTSMNAGFSHEMGSVEHVAAAEAARMFRDGIRDVQAYGTFPSMAGRYAKPQRFRR